MSGRSRFKGKRTKLPAEVHRVRFDGSVEKLVEKYYSWAREAVRVKGQVGWLVMHHVPAPEVHVSLEWEPVEITVVGFGYEDLEAACQAYIDHACSRAGCTGHTVTDRLVPVTESVPGVSVN